MIRARMLLSLRASFQTIVVLLGYAQALEAEMLNVACLDGTCGKAYHAIYACLNGVQTRCIVKTSGFTRRTVPYWNY